MSERDRTVDGGAASMADLSAEAFAASTPDVPADQIRCTECSAEYIGDEADGTICPTCRREMGIDQ